MYFHGTYRFTVCCIFPIEWKTSLLPSSMIRFRSDLRPGFFQNSDIFVGGFTGWVFTKDSLAFLEIGLCVRIVEAYKGQI